MTLSAPEPHPPLPADHKPAKTYPFKLDPFQQASVDCIERGESVLVSAHTSAGKTAVAEYAIAKSLRDGQRVVYTSPIKALSNQKYRDLAEEFDDVGLMTGDITINPSAACLIMTTEILRSMLYRGSELMREVAWVIYDEVHYMRDKERGVVWEESIILLPHKVRFVFLSATIPNGKEFAAWIAKVHQQPCHVIYTEYRPTPLQHYIFPGGGDGLHLVVDERGRFRDDNFQKAMATMSGAVEDEAMGAGKGTKKSKQQKQTQGMDLEKIIKMIMDRRYDPVIVFSFSKKDCEAYALKMSRLNFNEEEDSNTVEEVFKNAMDSLSEDDRKLPQIDAILPLLKRGVGIHHGGLLPIIKEVIEILFQEGLIKCLFATETFSMGINMPAKTVVFTQTRKFDGTDFRWITAGEYIQMSGRAGRRGLDKRGIVIQMLDEKMEPAVAKGILYGASDPLYSSFHLGYNMLLNLLRVEDADPEFMILQSFRQYQNEQKVPELEDQINALTIQKEDISIDHEEEVAQFYHLDKQRMAANSDLRRIIHDPKHCLPYLKTPGRLVRVQDGDLNWGWGVVVNFQKKKADGDMGKKDKDVDFSTDAVGSHYIVDVLLNCASENKDGTPVPCGPGDKGEMRVIPLMLPLLDGLSQIRLYLPKDLRPAENRQAVGKSVQEVLRRFPQGIPQLDPIKDMQIEDENLSKLMKRIADLEARLGECSFRKTDNQDERYKNFDSKMDLDSQIREHRKQMRVTQVSFAFCSCISALTAVCS